MKTIYQIFDRIVKRIFTLSNLAVINLINGLFGTNFPPDSEVVCMIPEFVNRSLGVRVADIFVTINGQYTFHIEAQMNRDSSMVLRVFEYGFYHALAQPDSDSVLHFAAPLVIYLDETGNIPEESSLLLDFGEQGTFTYKVKNYIYLKHDVTELNRRKMILLVPFQLLRLREAIRNDPTQENWLLLKELIENDILSSIEANVKVGNITPEDANQLRELTGDLYDHIYSGLIEAGGVDLKPLLEGAWELPNDKYRFRIDELEKQLEEKERDAIIREEKHIEKIESMTAEVESMMTEVESLTAEVKSKSAEIESMTAEMKSKSTEIESLTAEIESMTAEIKSMTIREKEMQEKYGDLLARVKELEANQK